jgi:hypothetical protein
MNKAIAKLFLKFLVLGVLAGSLWFYSGYAFSQSPPLRVVVARQPDSPLRVLSTYVDTTDPLRPRYGYSVTNISDKPIRAYAIQESVSLGPGPSVITTSSSYFPAVKLYLKSYETNQVEGGLGGIYQTPPVEVELTVDFVEFSDGTRWGDDQGKSGERLDGTRAGGKAAIKKFYEILDREGVDGLAQAIENPNLIEPENHPRPDDWALGFQTGVNMVKNRLRAAKTKGGKDEVKRELDKPFDSTEGRQEP